MDLIQWAVARLDQVPAWVPAAVGAAAGALVLGLALYLMYRAVTARARATIAASEAKATQRGRRFNWKLELGFAVVQAGLSVVTIWGVFEFFHKLLKIPTWEAALFAGFIEAAIWTTVGFIIDHGRSMVEKIGKDGQAQPVPATGWGMAGPFFWIFSVSAGVLAVLASTEQTLIGVGRAVVVVIGTSLWVLRLMRATNRPARRSRFRWTPYRIAVRIGWIEPDPIEDEASQNREWRVQGLTRAIRLKNTDGKVIGWVQRSRGKRMVTRLAEETTPDVLREALERYAAVRVLNDHTSLESTVMASIIAEHAATTVRLSQLGQKETLDKATADRRNAGVIDGHAEERKALGSGLADQVDEADDDETVTPIAGQFAKDQVAARTLVTIVSRLTGTTYDTWAQVRAVVEERELLNKIDRASKETSCPMSKHRAKRILGKAETLFDVPPPIEEAVARSA